MSGSISIFGHWRAHSDRVGRISGLVCHALVFEQGAGAPALAFVPPSQASGVLDEIAGEFHVGLLAKRFYMHVLPNTVARLIQPPSG
jgi:hypothetical protein